MIRLWNCMLLGELISLKLMISHIQRFTEIHIERKLKGFERLSTKRDGTLYFPFRRDRQDCRMEVFFKKTANMWRLTDDFWDEWELLYDMFDRCNYWSPFIRKGNWPDCDMLPLGHIGIRSGERGKADRMTCFTKPEQKTMITLWSIFQSPLMYGGELADFG